MLFLSGISRVLVPMLAPEVAPSISILASFLLSAIWFPTPIMSGTIAKIMAKTVMVVLSLIFMLTC